MASNLSVTPIKTAAAFQTWLAQIPPDLSLATVDMICKAELYRGTYSFSTSLIFQAISTASQYIWVAAAPGHEHKGVPGAGPLLTWTSVGSTGHCYKVGAALCITEDIEATWTGGTSPIANTRILRHDSAATGSEFRRCMVHDVQTGSLSTYACVGISLQNGFAYNCAVWNVGQPIQSIGNTRGISCAASEAGRFGGAVNCSVFSCYDGHFQATNNSSSATLMFVNCIAIAGPGSAASTSIGFRAQSLAGTPVFQNNASFDSSANSWGDANSLTSIPNVIAQFAAEPSTTQGLQLASTNTSAVAGGSFQSGVTWGPDIQGYDRFIAAGRVDRGAYQLLTSPRVLNPRLGS